MHWPELLIEATASKVVGYNHIRDRVKDKLDVLCVSSTGHVAINLLCCRFVFGLKLSLDISCGFTVLLGTYQNGMGSCFWSFIALAVLHLPVYSGKQIVNGDLRIFSSNKSFLLRKRMMDVSPNHLLLQMESKSFKLSCMRF